MTGYGEVGQIFSAGLKDKPGVRSVWAWDLKFAQADIGPVLKSSATAIGVSATSGMQQLCESATLLISAVTASRTLDVAREAARHVNAGAVFLDLNSASPGTKRDAAAAIEAAGGRYVEAGVMTSVPPYGIRVPMLLGGATAQALASQLNGQGMDASAVSPEIGVESAIKMCLSIMIKGLEALVIESYNTALHYGLALRPCITALHYGIADHVLPALAETFPQIDWSAQGAYFFSRVVQHGRRRAEEMWESAATVRDGGFPPLMAPAIADKQAWVAALAAEGCFHGVPKDAPWQVYAQRLLASAQADR
jgi:3-hydroxyisobutyrate dehydrogenase-like beta-hydroxyacid dehydrogenase